MIVILSQKSACASVSAWFFHQLGHGKAARDYHWFANAYRTEVYYKSDLYRRAFRMDLANFTVVRVVRDSFERAASSFRHAVAYGYVDQAIGEACGRDDVVERGYSFLEFLEFLEGSDLWHGNSHLRFQRHPVEDLLPVRHLINVSTQDLFVRLNEVEADLGLPITDLETFTWAGAMEERRAIFRAFEGESDPAAVRLTREQARRGPWPRAEALLTPRAREQIARIYAVDIESYGQAAI
jgi:hypothetical protein